MADTNYYKSPTSYMMEDQYNRGGGAATLLNREHQLREEIARLRREEQELREKDHLVKQNLMAVKEKIAAERRSFY
ncbi:MAG: hypothetical protein EXX96DRAFT_651390 [Benjaminiella poitrasii]|nr:MAG: hypothetical protein EXX96DRAFT_651390 [Benjaminiella poitrasii]